MKRRPERLVLLGICVAALVLSLMPSASAYPESVPDRRVYDGADFMPIQSRRDQLNQELLAYEHSHGGMQVAVVTVQDLDGKPIEDYAVGLFRAWGIGSRERNDGVLLLISREADDAGNRSRIEVGYGVEDRLTDADGNRIINEVMIPLSRGQHDPQGAIEAGTHAILRELGAAGVTAGAFAPPPPAPETPWWSWIIIVLLVIGFLYLCVKYDIDLSGGGGSGGGSYGGRSGGSGFGGGRSGGGGSSGGF